MIGFHFKNNRWYVDGVDLNRIAEKVGTPCFVYSLAAFEERFNEIDHAYRSVPHLVAYAMKANSNLSVLHALAKKGAGADVVSGGEIYLARKAGVPANKIIYAGVGKTKEEIRYALDEGIRYFNVESIHEIEIINELSGSRKRSHPSRYDSTPMWTPIPITTSPRVKRNRNSGSILAISIRSSKLYAAVITYAGPGSMPMWAVK